MKIDAGYPDIRLSPLTALARNFHSVLKGNQSKRLMNYTTSFEGDNKLRNNLADHLKNTRSINVGIDNIMITRGSLMAFYLLFQVILESGNKVIVGKPGFHVANNIIKITGGQLVEIAVDDQGIDVDAIEEICKTSKIKAVFIMPHHHNPTTVSLSAARRMKLVSMAQEYGFAIIEDDYDYDFHYDSTPILPIASTDNAGNVIYVGSLSKTIAPGLRMGYLVAPRNLISNISRLSRFLDCHGNTAMERAIALLFDQGEITRYLKKALKIYNFRRDHFCSLLKSELGDDVQFIIPDGGMAVWVKFDSGIHIKELRSKAAQKGLLTSKALFKNINGDHLNYMRMGFASLNELEAVKAISILKTTLN